MLGQGNGATLDVEYLADSGKWEKRCVVSIVFPSSVQGAEATLDDGTVITGENAERLRAGRRI